MPVIITGITDKDLFIADANYIGRLFSADQLRTWNAPVFFDTEDLHEAFIKLCGGYCKMECAIVDDVSRDAVPEKEPDAIMSE